MGLSVIVPLLLGPISIANVLEFIQESRALKNREQDEPWPSDEMYRTVDTESDGECES